MAVGDEIRDGQEIVSLSTDKVTVELPSPCDGRVVALHGEPGEVLTVGTVIALIATERGQALTTSRACARSILEI